MTISLERPAVPASGVEDMVEPYDERHTVVTLQLAVSRHQLAAALENAAVGLHGDLTDPDGWTVEEIRDWVSFGLCCMNATELEESAMGMAEMAAPDFYDTSLQWFIHGVYRAVDRAFPKTS